MTGITPMARKVQQIKQRFGGQIKVQEPDEIDPDEFFPVPNRTEKRRMGDRSKQAGTGKVHDLLRLGPAPKAKGGTGQPHWFKVMKYEAARRKALEKVTIDRLQPMVGQVALDLHAAGFKTVWDVTQVEDINTFLVHGTAEDKAHGIRSADLAKLRDYLTQQRVPVKWSV